MNNVTRQVLCAIFALHVGFAATVVHAANYEIIQFRKDQIDIFNENVKRIVTVPSSQLNALVGTTVSLDRGTSLYEAKMKGRTILLSPDDVMARQTSGGSTTDLCTVLAGHDTNTNTASSFGKFCN